MNMRFHIRYTALLGEIVRKGLLKGCLPEVAFTIIGLVLLVAQIPIFTAVALAGDEGMELSKGLLWASQPDLSVKMWNDQPFLHTFVIGALFRWFSPMAWIPRMIAVVAVLSVLLAMMRLMPLRSGRFERLCVVPMFFLWPDVLEQSVAAMIEMPAIALATVSVAIVDPRRSPPSVAKLLLGAVFFACALHIKLTAILVLPGFVLLVSLKCWWETKKQLWTALSVWCMGAAVAYAVIAVLSPRWSLESLWGSHHAAAVAVSGIELGSLSFSSLQLLRQPGTVASAVFGIVAFGFYSRKKLFEIAFPLGLLATALLTHSFHRPWWWYYNIHFAVAFSMFGALGLGAFLRSGLRISLGKGALPTGMGVSLRRVEAHAVAGAAVISLIIGYQLPGFWKELKTLQSVDTLRENELVAQMKRYSARTHWAFACGPGQVYAFHAGLLLPPELVVLAKKRLWTDQITADGVLQLVQKYRPEQILVSWNLETKSLKAPEADAKWKQFLTDNYLRVHSTLTGDLYVSRLLNPETPPTSETIMKRLGI